MLEIKVKLRKWRVGYGHPERETKTESQRGLGGGEVREWGGRDGFKEGETEKTEGEKDIDIYRHRMRDRRR